LICNRVMSQGGQNNFVLLRENDRVIWKGDGDRSDEETQGFFLQNMTNTIYPVIMEKGGLTITIKDLI